jgi:hypothetical protein
MMLLYHRVPAADQHSPTQRAGLLLLLLLLHISAVGSFLWLLFQAVYGCWHCCDGCRLPRGTTILLLQPLHCLDHPRCSHH